MDINNMRDPSLQPARLSLPLVLQAIQPWHTPERDLLQAETPLVTSITQDSRCVVPGSLFIAIPGAGVDGWQFVSQALESGARYVLGEHRLSSDEEELFQKYQASYLAVTSAHEALAALAQAYWHHPSKQLRLVGVTGTNGKTSTATMLYHLFTQLGYTVGLIGTVENRIGAFVETSTHTTPDPLVLAQLLFRMQQMGCSHVFMEVSSHAIHQHRIGSLHFTGALFTNLTRDHLDYHGTMQEYIRAKKMFFDRLPASSFALVNADDRNGAVMLQNTSARRYTYGLKNFADFKAKVVEGDLVGTELLVDNHSLWIPLVGTFNAYNVTLVYATARLLLPELEVEKLLAHLSTIKTAEGRFQVISEGGFVGIVDYAHTPDALVKVLDTIRPLLPRKGRLITVVGAGGNRDQGKRPLMAQEAFRRSDLLLLTSDNPRNEDPQAIINDMLDGLDPEEQVHCLTNVDRRSAIRTACRLATPRDVILIAGKGHETYQEIQGVRHHFDDREELRKALQSLIH